MLPSGQARTLLAVLALALMMISLSPGGVFSSTQGRTEVSGGALGHAGEEGGYWRLDLDYLSDAPPVGVKVAELVVGRPSLPVGERIDPEEIRRQVKAILKRGDYDLESELVPSWLGMMFRRLRQAISDRLTAGRREGGALSRAERALRSPLFQLLLVVVLIALLIFFVVRSGILARLLGAQQQLLAFQGVEARKLIGRAELHARRGEFREAVRLGFIALLEVLAIPYYHYLPNRELVGWAEREFPGLGNPLSSLAALFDQVVYAGRKVEGQAVEDYLRRCRRLIEEVEQRREAQQAEEGE